MVTPKYTVLMPTHYRPDVIGIAIESVLRQTEGSFELLVVGDGAHPDTAGVVQGFSDPRVRWFDLPKAPGYGYANRNIAMDQSTGRLVAFAADDDIMMPDHLEQLGRVFEDEKIIWAYSQAFWVSQDGVVAPDLTNLNFADERWVLLNAMNTISGGCMMFRREAFPTRRCWPEHVHESADWHMMQWLLATYGTDRMARVPLPTYFHFAAGTKTHRDSNFSLLSGWLDLADKAAWWPDVLRARSPQMPLQADFYDRLINTTDYVSKVRAASFDAVARAALELLDPRWGPKDHKRWVPVSQLERERAEAEGRERILATTLEAIRQSRSWRATSLLRAAIGTLRGR